MANPYHDELGRFASGPNAAPRAIQKQVMRAMEWNAGNNGMRGNAAEAAKVVGRDRGMRLKVTATRVPDKMLEKIGNRPMMITQLRGVGDVGPTYAIKVVKISGR